ncbi:pleckstrin homology domain-containing family H member 1-like isoform X1 [Acropora millepora]|uniref:pleckstrin homology domain-containing family H member 1-like isoform X1 n=2 Tax=Acropora millepora TaxID=45264 RepID=UPI001CF2AA6C|nr:pleckstrin homology domain-containing family H member 1-like isoform X1 [Acropora millepora]
MENSSTTTNGPKALFPEDDEEGEVDYKQRCKYLEIQLEKFREQAAKVREAVSQKVQHLERLQAMKEGTVAQLQAELENEKQRATLRDKEVEDKASQIKNWMHKKISEYDQKLQDNETAMHEYQKKIKEYEEKLDIVNKENEQLRNSHKKAMDMIREMEAKLSFSQDQVLRLSKELAEGHSQCGDYYVLEPESDQEESGIQSFETNRLMSRSSLDTDTSTMTPTPMSPDRLGDVFVDNDDDEAIKNAPYQPAEIRIKRTSSGKSPSKIPRYIGNSEDQRTAKISYYMSLKRGQKSPGGSQAKFFLQVQDLHNPYAHLVSAENSSCRKHYDSQSTVNSELDNDLETYLEPVDLVYKGGEGLHAELGELVTLHLDRRTFAPGVRTGQEVLSERSSSCSLTDECVIPNPIYQTLEHDGESDETHVNEHGDGPSFSGHGEPQSRPLPAIPSRTEHESTFPLTASPIPKSKQEDEIRTESNFTSYLTKTEIQGEEHGEVTSVADSTDNVAMQHMVIQPCLWNDFGSETPPYDTLDTENKNLNNLLTEQTCPVYTTLKGTASQLRNTPFSGESTDSSDNESSCGDYCTPPDELSPTKEQLISKQAKDGLEETTQVLKTCATYTTVSLKKGDQRKEGYLTKLGGHVKNWKKRWFVLSGGNLYYYKSENETNRKPLGQIPLDGTCRIARTDGALTFEVATPKRTFYLTGDTEEVVDDWLRVLHNVMRKFSGTPLFAQVTEKEVMKGWLTKAKHGSAKKCWTVLRGQYLCYFKSEDDMVPFSMTHMIDVIVEELEAPDHDAGLSTETVPYRHYTLVMKSLKQPASTYLLIDSKQEKDSWLFHLKVASGSGIDDMGTEFEREIFELISQDCDPESETWNSYVLTHVKDTITEPLTTLPSKELEKEALKLFKSIHLFTTVKTEEGAIDYHVTLAQNALQTCLDNPELQNEVYCQLIKQTSKHVHKGPEDLGHFFEYCGKSSWLREESFDISSQATIDLRPVQEFVYIQAWQLLSLCTALFAPKHKFLLFLKGHLNRSSTARTNQGKYGIHCLKNLERTLANGKREARPSRMEVLSVLLRKPYDHSCSMSIPVHFIDGSTQVFGFDGSTTVHEFTETINRIVGIRPPSLSGYALFTDNPVNLVEHCLQASVKLCDVISKWEQTMRQSQGRLDTSRIIKLSYKNRLHFKSLSHTETEKEKFFLVLQTSANVMKGRFPVSKEMALEFAALMAQIMYGDYRAQSNSLPSKRVETVISQFCAKAIKEDSGKRSRTLRMAEKWSTLHGWSQKECVDKYLENARRWPFFGSKLFEAQQKHTVSAVKKRAVQTEGTQPVWLAVEEDSISILEGEGLRLMCRYRYKHVVTFGGWKEDFMLVVNQSIMRGGNTVEQGTQRLLFVMSRGKILEITLLMASYINAIIRQKGITCDVTETVPTSRQGMDVKVWDLESAEWPMVPGSNVGLL